MQKTIIECVPELLDRVKILGLDDDAAEDLVARALTWARGGPEIWTSLPLS